VVGMRYGHAGSETFEAYYARKASQFASYVLTGDRIDQHEGTDEAQSGWKVPDNLRNAVTKVRFEADAPRFLIVKGLFPTPWFWTYSALTWDSTSWKLVPKRPKKVVSKHYYDLIASTLLHYMGVKHAPKHPPNITMFHDFVTSPDLEHDVFSAEQDIPPRYRTVDPELHFSEEVDKGDAHLRSPKYTIHLCVENPIDEPLYLLPAEKVVAQVRPAMRERLEKSDL